MTQSTARTGPSGLVRPTPDPTPATVRTATIDGDIEAALWKIRELAARPAPGPLSDATRFSIETAQGLAKHAPDLYDMSNEVAGRFRLIVNFLTTALEEADQLDQQANR